jgi:hypothetical protein
VTSMPSKPAATNSSAAPIWGTTTRSSWSPRVAALFRVLWGSASPTRRGISIAVLLGSCLFAALRPGSLDESWSELRVGPAAELRSLETALDRAGLAYRREPLDRGRIRLSVAGEDLPSAKTATSSGNRGVGGISSSLDRAAGDDASSPASAGTSALSRWFTPSSRSTRGEREQEVRAIVESMLRVQPQVEDAIVLYSKDEPPLLGNLPARKSASVRLVLREGIHGLSTEEARGIRELVSAALGIDEHYVKVFDQHRSYAPSIEALDVVETERRLNRSIETAVAELFSGSFAASEIEVHAAVAIARLPDEARRNPGIAPSSLAASRTELASIPRGLVVSVVRVGVILDVRVVDRIVRETRSIFAPPSRSDVELWSEDALFRNDVETFLEEQRDLVRGGLPYPPEITTVTLTAQIVRPALARPRAATAVAASSEQSASGATAAARDASSDGGTQRSATIGTRAQAIAAPEPRREFARIEERKRIGAEAERPPPYGAARASDVARWATREAGAWVEVRVPRSAVAWTSGLLALGIGILALALRARRRKAEKQRAQRLEIVCGPTLDLLREVEALVRARPAEASAILRRWLGSIPRPELAFAIANQDSEDRADAAERVLISESIEEDESADARPENASRATDLVLSSS